MSSQASQEDISMDEHGSKNGLSKGDVEKGSLEKAQGDQVPQFNGAGATPGLPPPPNGGFQAWLHILGAFMLFFNTWGILNAFGVFQTYYESGALFTKSSSDISWIGAIQSYMMVNAGLVSGPVYDRGYLRTLLVAGAFMICYLHKGFGVGIGSGLLFVPSVAILPTYFSTRLGLAVGLAAAGSSLGGVIYPIVLFKLIGEVGFGWALRVMGFIALVTLLLPIFVMKMRFKNPKLRDLIDWSAFTDVRYMVFTAAAMIGTMSLFAILFYLSYFAEDQHITDTSMAFYLVPIFNAASCFGRTIPDAISDKTGPLNLIAPGAFIVGVLIFCMIAVTSEAAVIVVAILTGIFSGVFIALPPVCFVALTKDKSKIGTRIGMGYAMIGFGILAGGPGGGSILGTADPLNWHGLWIVGGVAAFVSGLLCAGLRVSESGLKLNVKA